MKLSKAEVRMLKEWLELINRANACPFNNMRRCCISICHPAFPRCKPSHRCPCEDYTEAHVVRKVKAVIKENA